VTATPTAPDLTTQPAPSQDGVSPGADATPEVTRLLALIRWIITYGQQLATTLQQHADPARFADIAYHFQTTDLTHILARIARGLMLAAGLEAKLARWAAAGHEAQPTALRLPSESAPRDPPAATKPKVHHTNIIDFPPERMPSAEEVAAELRRRPIGAVLVDICHLLDVQAGDMAPGRFWDEVAMAVTDHGGDLVRLMFGDPLNQKIKEETRRRLAGEPPDDMSGWVFPELVADIAAIPPAEPPGGGRQPAAA